MPTQHLAPEEEWIWDKWQKDLIDYKGSITVRCGRQVGKSTSASKRRVNQMLDYPCSSSLIIAPAQRQSSELFIKVLGWLEIKNQEVLKAAGSYKPNPKYSAKANLDLKRKFGYDKGIFNEIPTKTTIVLKKDFKKPQSPSNRGSVCYALPAGKTGIYLRTFALDFLDIDEAAYVPEQVYIALKPMLAVSEKKRGLGWETFLSTPFGKGGFFYDSHHSKEYKKVHISTEDCPRISKEFLRKQRKRLTKALYEQEWRGNFTEELDQFFPTKLIKKCMSIQHWNFETDYQKENQYYLGADFAGYGGDENAFVVCQMIGEKLKVVKCVSRERVSATDTIGRTGALDGKFNFNKIFVDDGGLGSPITDILMERLGRKVCGLNNASKRIRVQGEEKKRGILKQDLYSNVLTLMEAGNLELINDPDLLRSMTSIIFKYSSEEDSRLGKRLYIFGKYSHLTEALVRACWCTKEKGLKLFYS